MGMFRSSRRHDTFDFDLLLPEHPARKASRSGTPANDVVDAEFVTVKETPARGYGNDNRQRRYQQRVMPSRPVSGVMQRVERRLGKLSVDAYSALVALSVIVVFGVSGGFTLVSGTPSAAQEQVNPLGLSHVTVTPQDADGMEVLSINGIVENHGGDVVAVPDIRADLLSENGQLVASVVIEAPVSEILGRQSHGFTTKLRHPGGKTPRVKLSFMETGVSGS